MARTPQAVTDAELAVLEALWDRGPSDRGQLGDALYPGKGSGGYTTVAKLLERLQAKGYVRHEPGQGRRTFAAAVTRDALISRSLLDVAEKLCDGSLTPLLTSLVRARPLSARQVQELRDILDRLTQAPGPARGRR